VARRRGGRCKGGTSVAAARRAWVRFPMPPGYAASLFRAGKAAAHFSPGRARRKLPGSTSDPKRRTTPMTPPVKATNSGRQRMCVDGCDKRAPVRDLYDLKTSRCPAEAKLGPDAGYRGGANMRPDCPGASRAGSGDWALDCDVSTTMLAASMKDVISILGMSV
jgi:hypothetical protein